MDKPSPVRIIKQPHTQILYCTMISPKIASFNDLLNWHHCGYQREDKILGNNICTDYRPDCACHNQFRRVMTV